MHALEVEGSRASAKAKAVILANEKPLKWQRRWVIYSALFISYRIAVVLRHTAQQTVWLK